MSGLELNKIVAAILFASLVAMLGGFIANILYKPNFNTTRGYAVEIKGEQENLVSSAKEVTVDIKELLQNANAEAGKKIANKCISCHSFEKDGANKIGPNLWNIVHSDIAKVSGYKYSAALQAKGGKWDEESLAHFLHKPSAYAPGTKMSFAGISKQSEIADVIAFLKTLVD